jgi:NhaP-type Na+/H+ or K+/H+ antiporter
LIDPIGGILGALVFHAVSASTSKGPGSQLAQFLLSLVIGLAGGVIGTALLWLLLRKLRLGEVLGTNAPLAVVVAVAAGCDALRNDTGLVAAIFMGLALANMRSFDIPARRPFSRPSYSSLLAYCSFLFPPPSPRSRFGTSYCPRSSWSRSWSSWPAPSRPSQPH